MVTTTIAAAGGCLSTLVVASLWEGLDEETGKLALRLEHANNGVLSGLVAVTASCAVIEPLGAAVSDSSRCRVSLLCVLCWRLELCASLLGKVGLYLER
jgi:ammonia channel protein AmtB